MRNSEGYYQPWFGPVRSTDPAGQYGDCNAAVCCLESCDVCAPASYSPTIITPSPLWKIAAVVFKLCLITSNTPGTKKQRASPRPQELYITKKQ